MNRVLSGKTRIRLRQIFGILLGWVLLNALDTANTIALFRQFSRSVGFPYRHLFWLNLGAALLGAVLSGALLVFYLRERFRRRPFGFSLLVNSLVVIIIMYGIGMLAYLLLGSDRTGPTELLLHSRLWFGQGYFLKNLVYWLLIALTTIIFLNINEKYGPGIFPKLLLGRYHKAREEERIFLFVDMRSSTLIAERLGHIQFFNLLNDFFRDLTNPVIDYAGEIYQYVGDEIVVSWPMEKGLRNANCIQCFYAIEEAIRKAGPRYANRYGLVPDFKAGLHAGTVTTGEVGVIKKDIVFSGDVMNTTSRIQSVCNKFRVKILVSKYLLDRLELPPDSYDLLRVGIIELSGKSKKVELYTLGRPQQPHPKSAYIAAT